MRDFVAILLFTAASAIVAQPVRAADNGCGHSAPCCDRCGSHTTCLQQTWCTVCEMQKETRSCWCIECQEICTLLPGCHHRCEECQPPPRCGRSICVKKLVRKQYQVDVPVYRCVVLHLCPQCLSASRQQAAAANPSLPPPPSVPRPLSPTTPRVPR